MFFSAEFTSVSTEEMQFRKREVKERDKEPVHAEWVNLPERMHSSDPQ
jgi:hypothetical protein